MAADWLGGGIPGATFCVLDRVSRFHVDRQFGCAGHPDAGLARGLAGGILFVGFLLLAEAARRTIGIVAFVTLVYSGAAILLWAAVLALDLPVVGLSLETYLAFIGLGLVSQIIGHTGFNWAVRAISPMVLALLFLTEPLLSTALGWFYFGEGFARETGIGGVLILSAIYLGVRARGTPIAEQTG